MERNLSPSQTRTKNLNTAIKTPPQKIYTKMHHFQGHMREKNLFDHQKEYKPDQNVPKEKRREIENIKESMGHRDILKSHLNKKRTDVPKERSLIGESSTPSNSKRLVKPKFGIQENLNSINTNPQQQQQPGIQSQKRTPHGQQLGNYHNVQQKIINSSKLQKHTPPAQLSLKANKILKKKPSNTNALPSLEKKFQNLQKMKKNLNLKCLKLDKVATEANLQIGKKKGLNKHERDKDFLKPSTSNTSLTPKLRDNTHVLNSNTNTNSNANLNTHLSNINPANYNTVGSASQTQTQTPANDNSNNKLIQNKNNYNYNYGCYKNTSNPTLTTAPSLTSPTSQGQLTALSSLSSLHSNKNCFKHIDLSKEKEQRADRELHKQPKERPKEKRQFSQEHKREEQFIQRVKKPVFDKNSLLEPAYTFDEEIEFHNNFNELTRPKKITSADNNENANQMNSKGHFSKAELKFKKPRQKSNLKMQGTDSRSFSQPRDACEERKKNSLKAELIKSSKEAKDKYKQIQEEDHETQEKRTSPLRSSHIHKPKQQSLHPQSQHQAFDAANSPNPYYPNSANNRNTTLQSSHLPKRTKKSQVLLKKGSGVIMKEKQKSNNPVKHSRFPCEKPLAEKEKVKSERKFVDIMRSPKFDDKEKEQNNSTLNKSNSLELIYLPTNDHSNFNSIVNSKQNNNQKQITSKLDKYSLRGLKQKNSQKSNRDQQKPFETYDQRTNTACMSNTSDKNSIIPMHSTFTSQNVQPISFSIHPKTSSFPNKLFIQVKNINSSPERDEDYDPFVSYNTATHAGSNTNFQFGTSSSNKSNSITTPTANSVTAKTSMLLKNKICTHFETEKKILSGPRKNQFKNELTRRNNASDPNLFHPKPLQTVTGKPKSKDAAGTALPYEFEFCIGHDLFLTDGDKAFNEIKLMSEEFKELTAPICPSSENLKSFNSLSSNKPTTGTGIREVSETNPSFTNTGDSSKLNPSLQQFRVCKYKKNKNKHKHIIMSAAHHAQEELTQIQTQAQTKTDRKKMKEKGRNPNVESEELRKEKAESSSIPPPSSKRKLNTHSKTNNESHQFNIVNNNPVKLKRNRFMNTDNIEPFKPFPTIYEKQLEVSAIKNNPKSAGEINIEFQSPDIQKQTLFTKTAKNFEEMLRLEELRGILTTPEDFKNKLMKKLDKLAQEKKKISPTKGKFKNKQENRDDSEEKEKMREEMDELSSVNLSSEDNMANDVFVTKHENSFLSGNKFIEELQNKLQKVSCNLSPNIKKVPYSKAFKQKSNDFNHSVVSERKHQQIGKNNNTTLRDTSEFYKEIKQKDGRIQFVKEIGPKIIAKIKGKTERTSDLGSSNKKEEAEKCKKSKVLPEEKDKKAEEERRKDNTCRLRGREESKTCSETRPTNKYTIHTNRTTNSKSKSKSRPRGQRIPDKSEKQSSFNPSLSNDKTGFIHSADKEFVIKNPSSLFHKERDPNVLNELSNESFLRNSKLVLHDEIDFPFNYKDSSFENSSLYHSRHQSKHGIANKSNSGSNTSDSIKIPNDLQIDAIENIRLMPLLKTDHFLNIKPSFYHLFFIEPQPALETQFFF